ncbi:carboxypeptidase regulatory-like domain-containing protein [Candidatus Acetothermia bacterium]|nr:carboxypeptidase regulatory-like domain-containing protein [Candidatus Acetothermia bacterium]
MATRKIPWDTLGVIVGIIVGVIGVAVTIFIYLKPFTPPTPPCDQRYTPKPFDGLAPNTGRISLESNDTKTAKGARVYLKVGQGSEDEQGEMLITSGGAFYTIDKLSPATYTVRISNSGYRDFTAIVCVEVGKLTTVPFDLGQ